MEKNPHDQYVVKVDRSGRLTHRNRRFLRAYESASPNIECAPPGNLKPSPLTQPPSSTTDTMPQSINEPIQPYPDNPENDQPQGLLQPDHKVSLV